MVFARYYADTDGYYYNNMKWRRYKNLISAEMGSFTRKNKCSNSPIWTSDDETKNSASGATVATCIWWQVALTKSGEFAANHKTFHLGTVTYAITWN